MTTYGGLPYARTRNARVRCDATNNEGPTSFRGVAMNVERWNSLAALGSEHAYRTTDLDAARQHIGSLFVPHCLDVVG